MFFKLFYTKEIEPVPRSPVCKAAEYILLHTYNEEISTPEFFETIGFSCYRTTCHQQEGRLPSSHFVISYCRRREFQECKAVTAGSENGTLKPNHFYFKGMVRFRIKEHQEKHCTMLYNPYGTDRWLEMNSILRKET